MEPLPIARWETVEKLFQEASELPASERESFLGTRCGADHALCEEVLSLLRFDSRDETTLLDALYAEAANVLDEQPAEGRMLGSWRIERELGRGGMSVVYLGSRADGEFRKSVALKLIRRGMDTDAVIARMHRERRILASLDHPCISRLLDGGTTADGLPWIAMEYVDGAPIDDYCRERQLDIEQRCELIIQLCDAVAYAHRNLIVHGDIKPGNILVGADGNPRLLDFGIAKLLRPDDGTSTVGPLTRGLIRPYTPEYASPEQLAGEAIGTATDVYSLGVVLYELLAGTRPRVRGDAGIEKASAAALRGEKSKRWASRLRGDLDNILQTALRKEPERRYLSVSHLALDIRRHLEGLPVSASRETVAYRLGKFLRRHRFSAAAVLILTILATVGAGMYVKQARIAEKRFNDLRRFANAFLYGVDDQLRAMPDSVRARKLVAETALSYLNSLAAENSSDPGLRREAGNAWRRLADLQGGATVSSLGDSDAARISYRRSIALLEPLAAAEKGPRQPGDARDDLVASLQQLTELELAGGPTATAEQLVRKTLPIAEDTGTPPNPRLQGSLGLTLTEYADVLRLQGRLQDSSEQGKKAIALLELAVRSVPRYRDELCNALGSIGTTERLTRDFSAAFGHFQRRLEIRKQLAKEAPEDRGAQRTLMLAWASVGDIYSTPGKDNPVYNRAEGAASYLQMAEVARKLVNSDPSDTTAQRDLAICLERLATGYLNSGRPQLAVESNQEAIARLTALKKLDPNDRIIDTYLASGLFRLATQELKLQRPLQAQADFARAISIWDALAAKDPRMDGLPERRLDARERLASSCAETGNKKLALELVRQIEVLAKDSTASVNTAAQRALLPQAWRQVAAIFEKLHDPVSAKMWYQRCLDEWNKLEPLSPQFADERDQAKVRLAALSQ